MELEKNKYDEILEIVENCEFDEPGDSPVPNRSIFNLAQVLQGICPDMFDDSELMREIVDYWYEYHGAELSNGKGEFFSYDEVWAIFIDVWPKIKFPKTFILEKSIEKAKKSFSTLHQAQRYKDKKIQLLVAICYELQQTNKKNPFWLSCKDAGQIINVSHNQANQFLKMLVHDGILKIIENHTPYKARRYMFIEDKNNDDYRR